MTGSAAGAVTLPSLPGRQRVPNSSGDLIRERLRVARRIEAPRVAREVVFLIPLETFARALAAPDASSPSTDLHMHKSLAPQPALRPPCWAAIHTDTHATTTILYTPTGRVLR